MYSLDDKAMAFTVYFNHPKTDVQTIKRAVSKLYDEAFDVKEDPSTHQKIRWLS